MKHQSFPVIVDASCERVRVAEGNVAAVDRCGCGMYQVHLAAFTVRLAPDALASLSGTLSEALASSEAPLGLARGSGAGESAADRWSKS